MAVQMKNSDEARRPGSGPIALGQQPLIPGSRLPEMGVDRLLEHRPQIVVVGSSAASAANWPDVESSLLWRCAHCRKNPR